MNHRFILGAAAAVAAILAAPSFASAATTCNYDGDAGTDTLFVDASDTVSTVESKTFVGKLGGSAKTIRGDAGETVSLPLTWTHPKAWKRLRRIEVLSYDGAKRVGSVKLTPAGAVSAKAPCRSTGTRPRSAIAARP